MEIAPSKLGTKDFWEQRYEVEYQNFREFGDEGEIWFGTSAENRIVKYLNDTKTGKESAILDVGCGNGSVLRRLRAKGFKNLKGVDYCIGAVRLAEGLANSEREENEEIETDIQFEQLDITDPKEGFFENQYEIILDKGTWDAMSLSAEKESRLDLYREFLEKAMKNEGKFVIFSCNFTIDELKTQFSTNSMEFVCEVAASHSFSFGGKQGVTSTGAVFRRI